MKLSLIFSVLAAGCLTVPATTVYLTDMSVFGADAAGNLGPVDIWDSRPGGNFDNFVRDRSTGMFLNGPADSQARPNIALTTGLNRFDVFGDPGADISYFGVNLFFNGAGLPGISAFGPMLTASGPGSFMVNTSTHTLGPFGSYGPYMAAAGALSFVYGDLIVTLTEFSWATPSVNNLDLVGQTSVGPNGIMDYVGRITLSVTQVPEPTASALAVVGSLVWAAARRPRRSR